MKTSRTETARNRERILAAAGRLLRERGLNGVSVNDIMASAGFTHGGFYRHFSSRQALATEACALVAQKTGNHWHEMRDAAAEHALEVLIERYLTPEHRDAKATGCIYAILGAEAGRSSDDALHQIFSEGIEELIDILGDADTDSSPNERRRNAIGRLSTLAGALVLSRAARGTALSDDILSEARAWLISDVASSQDTSNDQ